MTDSQTPPPLPDLPALPNVISSPDERENRRVGRMAFNWSLSLLAITVPLLLNTPHSVDHRDRAFLYAASTSLACLTLITVVGLIYRSVVGDPGAQLAKEQKILMGFSAVTLLLAVLFRLALLIPLPLFLSIIDSVIFFVLLLIYLARKIYIDRQTPPPPPDLPALPNVVSFLDEREYRRVGKMAYNWSLALIAITVPLLLNTLHSVDHNNWAFLYAASTSLAWLTLITVVGLIYRSVVGDPSAQLAKEQKILMGFSAVTLLLAVLSHLALLIPWF